MPREALEGSNGLGAVFDGRYKIDGVLGQGGMGTVYRALDQTLDRPVALKLLLPRLNSKEVVIRRFQNEARALTSMDHPAIVQTYAMGVADATPFIVMKLVEGIGLDEWLEKEGPLTLVQFKQVFADVLSALEHAHSRGVIHRDIKPSNIIVGVSPAGALNAVVLDFGIAKVIQADQRTPMELTRTGELIGSPLFMSPEQANGDPSDERTDVYSVCCVMFYALTGEPPFAGDSQLEIMYKHVHETAPDLVATPGVPLTLAALIHQGLQKDKNSRQQSATELLLQLVECCDQPAAPLQNGLTGIGRATLSGQATQNRRTKKKLRGGSKRQVAILVSSLTLSAVAATLYFQASHQDQAPPNPADSPQYVSTRLKFDYLKQKESSGREYESLGDEALRLNDIDVAMESYKNAGTAYKDKQSAMRCARNFWKIYMGRKTHRREDIVDMTYLMADLAIRKKEYEFANTILAEMGKRLKSQPTALNTQALHFAVQGSLACAKEDFPEAVRLSKLSVDRLKRGIGSSARRRTALSTLCLLCPELGDKVLAAEVAEIIMTDAAYVGNRPDLQNQQRVKAATLYALIDQKESQYECWRLIIANKQKDCYTCTACLFLGQAYLDQKRYKEAESLFKQALNLARELHQDPANVGLAAQNVGEALYRQKKYSEAKKYLQLAHSQYQKQLLPNQNFPHAQVGGVAHLLGRIAALEGNKTEQLSYQQEELKANIAHRAMIESLKQAGLPKSALTPLPATQPAK